jgi:putative peptide zinc metalloprotease protein
MPPSAAALSDLERRKKVRLRLRVDLAITPQKYEGRTYFVVKDPVSLRYYRFKEQEHFLLQFMDGKHTLDEAQKEYEKRFRPERLTLEDLEGFGQQLLTAGLAQNESPRAGKQLFDRRKKRKRNEWLQALTNILYIKIPIIDPDRILERMLQHLRWIFTGWFATLSVGVMLAAILLVLTHFDTFRDKLPSYHEFFRFQTVIYLWVALGIVKVIHEFGHGLSCKAFGGEVHEMGALFLCLSPCLYCNVSDAWTLPNKWKRIIISFAGIYVELIIASLATFLWWNSPNHPLINNLSLSLMVVCSVSTVVFNANPLMRYDGYYVLADWLEIPNLRDRSNRFLKNVVLDYCLGVEVQPEAYMTLWRRCLFVVYAIVSYIYRWVVTFSILYFMYSFLKPYKLGVISSFLALFAAGSMIGWPLARLGKFLYKRGRLPDMKTARVTATASVLAALVLAAFVIPLPVSRIRQSALIQVQPEFIKTVTLYEAGILLELKVRNGEQVKEGDELAVFRCQDLNRQLQEAETQCYIYSKQIQVLSPARNNGGQEEDLEALDKAEKGFSKNDGIKTSLHRRLDKVEPSTIERFYSIKAPRAGIVMSPPSVDDVGKSYEQGAQFCSIGDPTRLRALMPIGASDYQLLKGDSVALLERGQVLNVDIRVQGRGSAQWKGRLEPLPETDSKSIPGPLTNREGGPVAVKPGGQPGAPPQPQSQQYLIGVDFITPDDAICPGCMAQVKVHCRWRTLAWWAWRTISNTFDLGLI